MSGVKFYITPAIAYFLVANPKTYELTRSVLGSWVSTQDGVAKTGGLILHAVVFILLTILLMRLFRNVSYDKAEVVDKVYSKSAVEERSKTPMRDNVKKVFRPFKWWR